MDQESAINVYMYIRIQYKCTVFWIPETENTNAFAMKCM